MILVIGAKGGVGTTLVAHELVRASRAIGLDRSDGQLAARLERTTWPLAWLTYAAPAQRRKMVETIIQRRFSLMWSAECNVTLDSTWTVVRDIANRRPIVIDGGIASLDDAAQWSEHIVIVSADNDVAHWHERRLLGRYPRASVIDGTKEAARALAAQLFKSV
jgi:hypothetical protein